MCGHSHLRKCELISTTADFHLAWEQHVTSVETDLGRVSIVAQLISDSASYYDSDALDQYNLKKGIAHLYSPPYTQGLNMIAERDNRTLMEMARCMLIQSAAPKNRYGRALLYSTYILNRLPYTSGELETCIERYYQRKIANPRRHIRVFGCAAWVHLSHPTGPHVDKLDPKAELHVLVGFDSQRRCYILETLQGKMVYSAHCIFNESMFPWKARSDYDGARSSDFLFDDTLSSINFPRTRVEVHVPNEPDHEPAARPQRSMVPTAKVIANVAQAASEATELGDFALLVRDAEAIFAAISSITSNEPKTANAAFKTPDAEVWAKALAEEVGAHYKEQTLGPALSTLPPGSNAILLEAIFRTKRDGRKKGKPESS